MIYIWYFTTILELNFRLRNLFHPKSAKFIKKALMDFKRKFKINENVVPEYACIYVEINTKWLKWENINFGANWNVEFPGLETHVAPRCAPIYTYNVYDFNNYNM